MKKKWNWLDTLIVILVIGILVGLAFFLLRPEQSILSTHENVEFSMTVDAKRDRAGAYDELKAGDEIFIVGEREAFGVIEKVEELPYLSTSFNEETKQLEASENLLFPRCVITIKTNGYMDDDGKVFANGTQLIINENIYLETKTFRVGGVVSGVKGVGNK